MRWGFCKGRGVSREALGLWLRTAQVSETPVPIVEAT
jgi:hypothetical protein